MNKEKFETITGIIEVMTYRNSDNGFFVCKIKVKGIKDNIAITGSTSINLNIGEVITATGTWKQNPKYGMQLHAQAVAVELPKSISGIQKYLSSGVIKGIGPTFAKHIIEMFGDQAINIIETSHNELTKIRGISLEKAAQISQNWLASLQIKEMMLFLQSHNVTVNLATKIHRTYGDIAINILRENPYILARDIKGIGFLSADKIAQNLGLVKTDPKRITAGIEHTLLNATANGSCGLPLTILIEKALDILEVEQSHIEDSICDIIQSGQIMGMIQNDTTCKAIEVTNDCKFSKFYTLNPIIFNKLFFYMERNIAEKLLAISKTGNSILQDVDLENALFQLSEKYNIKLAQVQQEAILKLKNNKVLVITGGPGTGKTTLINAIIKILKLSQAKIGSIQIKLAAPTGRAAKRIFESSGIFSSTIHRLLEFDRIKGGFKYNETNYLKCDLMVLDEASMIDTQLMHAILKALPRTATLIIVGDVDQLPSIGAGQILADIINSGVISTVKLNEVFRQAKHSKIITNAHLINSSKMPYMTESDPISDFEFISTIDDITTINEIKSVMKRQSQDMVSDVQLLTPMQRGSVGVKSLNPILQQLLNPNSTSVESFVESYGIKYFVNDKIIQTENNYEKGIFNGDIGYITHIDKEDQQITINFDGHDIKYEVSELDQISLAYAITIHKAQGSEYHTVIMPILTQHFIMLNKKLLYTGITRAKKRLILIGQKKAIAMAINSKQSTIRYSMLKSWLSNSFSTQ